jgi:hypothetical protein
MMKNIKEKLGDFFIDIAKLVFGGVVLSVILDISDNKSLILFFGILATVSLATGGFLILMYKNKLKN